MDYVPRPRLIVFLVLVLALVSGHAGAVAIPQGPDNVNLHASDGIDLTSRASKWEFQQAADQLQARGGFNVGGKGMGFAGNMMRNIGRAELMAAARGASRLLGGYAGAAALLAPIIWDAINEKWMLPDVPDPAKGEGTIFYGNPPSFGAVECGSFSPGFSAYKTGSNSVQYVLIDFSQSTMTGWVMVGGCSVYSHPAGMYMHVKYITSNDVCWGSPNGVAHIDAGCTFGGSGRAVTDQEFADALAGGLDGNPPAAAGLADYMHSNGVPFEAGDPYTEGPPHVQGPTEQTTTTTDAGTTTSTKDRAWDMVYQGQDVTITDTETTTTTDEAGNTTTKNESHTSTGGDAPPSSSDAADKSDICVDHPDASACSPLGDVGDDPELPQQDVAVAFDYSSTAGSCPAPKQLSFLGQNFEWSFDGPCSFARGVRPVVIALALLGAIVLVVRVGRG